MATTTLGRIMHANNGVSTCCRSSINVQKRCLCSITAQSRPRQGPWLVPLAARLPAPRCAGPGLRRRTRSLQQPSSGLGEGGTASGRRGTFYFGCWGQWLADPIQSQFGILCDLCRAPEGIASSGPGLWRTCGRSDGGDLSSSQGIPSGGWCQAGGHQRGLPTAAEQRGRPRGSGSGGSGLCSHPSVRINSASIALCPHLALQIMSRG